MFNINFQKLIRIWTITEEETLDLGNRKATSEEEMDQWVLMLEAILI